MKRWMMIGGLAIWLVLGIEMTAHKSCHADELLKAAAAEDEAQVLRAQERFLELLRKRPRPGTALDRVYEFHLERGTLDEFMVSLREASATETDGVSATILGLIELQRGHNAEAADILRTSEMQRPGDPLVVWSLGRALNQAGQFTEAAAAFERAIARGPEHTELLSIFQELGRAYRSAQQHAKAADVWSRMEQQFPKDLRVKEQIAHSMYEEGDFHAALPRFQDLSKLTGDPYLATQASIFAAEIQLRLNQQDEALKTFESLLNQLDPDSWLYRDIRQRIESVFVKSGDHAGLVTYYESWLRTHPDDLDAMARLGRSLAYQGRFEDARQWYAKALKRAPSDVGLREAMIEQLIREEKYADAIGHYEQLSRAGIATADHIEEWGFLCLNRKDLAKDERQTRAADVWMLLVKDKHDDAVTISHVGDLMRDADLSDRALKLYQQAVALRPDQPQYKIDLGELYHSLHQRDEALATWNAIAAGDQRTTDNLLRLANVFRSHGYRDEALQAMRDAVELSPEFNHRMRLAQLLRDDAADGQTARLEESLAQLDLAAAVAESPEDREAVLQERIRSLEALGRLVPTADQLAQELAAKRDATSDRWLMLALYRDALGELPEATAAIEEAVRIDNASVAALRTAVDLFERAGRPNDAADALRRLTELDQRFTGEHLQKLMTLEQKLGRFQEALQAGKQLLASAPGNSDHMRRYANLCFQVGEYEEGLNTLRRAVRVNASDVESLLALARALMERNEIEEAIELHWRAFDRSTVLADRRAIVNTLAEVYHQTNRFDQLVQKLELRSRELNQRRDMVFCLAQAYRSVNDLTSCREVLERLASAESRDVELLTELSSLATEGLDLEAAADYERRINVIQPSDEGRLRLANLLVQLGDVMEAEAIRMRVMEAHTDPVSIFRWIDQQAAAGRLDSAREKCRSILQREPENWEAMLRDGLFAWREGKREEALKSFDSILALTKDLNELSAEAAQASLNAGGAVDLSERRLDRVANATGLGQLLSDDDNDIVFSAMVYCFSVSFGHSSTQETMPQDLGEARIVCQCARVLNATDDQKRQALFSELLGQATESMDAAWESCGVLAAVGTGCEASSDRARWISLARVLGQKGIAGSAAISDGIADDGQLALINIFIQLRNPTLEYEDANGRRVAYSRIQAGGGSGGWGCGCFGGTGFAVVPPDHAQIESTAPPLVADDLDAFFQAFERVADMHPEWLNSEHVFGLQMECRLANASGRLRELATRMTTADRRAEQLDLALQVLLQLKDTTAANLLDVVARIDRQQQSAVTTVRQNPNQLGDLFVVGERILQTDDTEGHLRLLTNLVNRAVSRVQGSQLTGSALARELNRIWQPSEFLPYQGKWAASGDEEVPFELRCLEYQELSLLRALRESWIEEQREADLNEWFRAQKAAADPKQTLVLELMQASFAARDNKESDFEWHLIRALELSPDDHELRGRLIAQCKRKQRYPEALALLEQIPDDNIEVLKAREFEVLSVALKAGERARAVTAAKRLYGFQLDEASRTVLAESLRELNLPDMAGQVEARVRVIAPPRKVPTHMELLEQYRKEGNLNAAVQVAQQILRRRSPASMYGIHGTSNRIPDPHTVALKVLRDCGKLEAMIARQAEQLEKSPQSVLLLESLQELYRAANDRKSAIAIGQRLIAARPNSSTTELLQLAEDLESQTESDAACDVLLKLLREHPIPFLRSYSDWAEVFRTQGRLNEVATIIEQMGPKKFVADPSAVCEFVTQSIDEEDSRRIGVSLLAAILQASPESNIELYDGLDDPEVWKHPAMFEVLVEQLVPTADPATQKMPAWSVALDEDFEQYFDRSQSQEAFGFGCGWLPLLYSTLETREFQDLFRSRIRQAQKSFPTWRDGQLLLLIADNFEGRHQEAHVRLERIVENVSFRINDDKAFAVALVLQQGDMLAKQDACRLLEKALEQNPPAVIDFSKPNIMLLLQLYAMTDQAEKGRAFVLTRLGILESGATAVQSSSSAKSRFSAACCLIELDGGLDALQILKSIDHDEAHELVWQASSAPVNFYYMLARAVETLSPASLTRELMRQPDHPAVDKPPRIDLRVVVSAGRAGQMLCVSEILDELEPLKPGTEEQRAEILALAETLSKSLDAGSVDSSLAIVAVHLILTSGDDKSIASITPALDHWLTRPVPEFDPTADSATLIRTVATEIAFTNVARRTADQPGLETLSERLQDRAIAIGRQLPDKQYLAALLHEQGTRLKAQGDPVSAEQAWEEMRSLNIPDLDTPLNTPADIKNDLGAELRKQLLKNLP